MRNEARDDGVSPHTSRPKNVNIEHLGAGNTERLRAIRLRALQDAPDAFATTFEEAASWPPQRWESQLEQLATFVATANGSDLGLVRGAAHDDFKDAGYLISMWVAPESRRRGIGSALVDALIDWARTQGFSRLFLDVVETELLAITLYSHKGFIPNGEVGTLPPPRDNVHEIQMVKEL